MMASFGIASYPEDGDSIQEIIGAADEMMYLVKNSSRGTSPSPSAALFEA